VQILRATHYIIEFICLYLTVDEILVDYNAEMGNNSYLHLEEFIFFQNPLKKKNLIFPKILSSLAT